MSKTLEQAVDNLEQGGYLLAPEFLDEDGRPNESKICTNIEKLYENGAITKEEYELLTLPLNATNNMSQGELYEVMRKVLTLNIKIGVLIPKDV